MEQWKKVAKELKQFTIKDLLTTVSKLDILPVSIEDSLQDFADVKRKEDLLKLYVDVFKESTDEDTAFSHLVLLYFSQRSHRKNWTVYTLTGVNYDVGLAKDPEELEREIHNELHNRHLNSKIAVQLHDGAYWFRINVTDRRTRNRRKLMESTAFCVHYRGTNSIAVSGLRKWHLDSIFQALGAAIEFENTEITALQDCNLKGILQLHYDKQNPHLIQLGNVRNPLASAEVRESVEEDFDERIIHLQKERATERKRYTDGKFGVDEIPPIKKLTYELAVPFAGLQHAPKMIERDKQAFHCRVEFEGPSVIEGLTEMVKAGICDAPFPRYLADIRTTGRNKVLVKLNSPDN